MKQVQEKPEGIVFKVVIDTETNSLEDGSPAHPDDLARFEPWKDKLKTFGVKVKRCHLLAVSFVYPLLIPTSACSSLDSQL